MTPIRKLTILNLEERVVPAFTLNETASTVTFTGDATGDTLTVTITANSIAYQVNGGPPITLSNATPQTLRRWIRLTCVSA